MASTKEGQPYRFEPVSKLTPGEDGLLPPLTPEEYAALKADIKKNNSVVVVPISIDDEYVVLDGHHRLRACKELGIERVPTRMHSALDQAEKQDLALALNLNRRNLNREQKREVIAAVLRQDPKRSDRRIGEAVGVDNKTVGSVRAELEEREEIPHLAKREDRRGCKQPASKRKGTSGRRPASGSKSSAKPDRARTRAERKAKTGEVTLPITFKGKDADVPERIQRLAGDELATNAWCVRVLREAVEAVESSEQLKKVA
jgi:ParB-like chromosome segregation protein Spo0J